MKIVLDTNVLVYVYISPEFVPRIRKEEWHQNFSVQKDE